MTLAGLAAVLLSCSLLPAGAETCVKSHISSSGSLGSLVAGVEVRNEVPPVFVGEALDVELTAQAAVVWDEATGTILYEKNASEERPVASIMKLLSALVVRDQLAPQALLEVPSQVRKAQRQGAHIRLPVGEHVTVAELLSAGLIASANDALVTLALGVADSEEDFAQEANAFAKRNGFYSTRMSTATGLDGGEQFATAQDVMGMFRLAYHDGLLRNMLVDDAGELRTEEGTYRRYESTNQLLGTYFPVLAGKTGYTPQAGQNLVVMTFGDAGQRVGAAVLGSEARFQDMKVLIEWIWRNYSWR